MAYQEVGRGASANDGTGDDLRTGAGKLNANIVELYAKINGVATSAVSDGTALTSDSVVLLAETQTLTNKTLTDPVITGTGAIAGVFTGNLTGNVTGDLTGNVSTSSGNIQLDAATQIVEVRGDGSATEGAIVLNCETNAHGQTIKPQPHSAAVTNELLLPAGANSTLVSEVATQTLTNKTLTDPTITGTGAIAGVFTGNITGDVTGNVTGDLTGDVTGNVSGNLDGIVGGTTPSAGSFTELSSSTHFQAAVYADTTARDAAITSPAAGMVAYLTATNKLQVYTGSAWETITSA